MENVESKEITSVNEDELAGLLAQNQKLQENENEGDGVKADYIILAKSGTKALSKLNEDLYVPGLKQGDIFIQKDKKVLGESIKVVPLAFITLYDEKEADNNEARFFGRWNKEQASQFPFVEGSDFNHVLPNGHVLCPVNWVCVDVIGHPEIENGVIVFKKTGSRIWRQWKEDTKKRSGSSATLIYEVKEAQYGNDKYKWTDFDFSFSGNLLETDRAQAIVSLKKSNAIREANVAHSFIGNHDVSVLNATPVQAYIEDASATAEASDDDMDEAGF